MIVEHSTASLREIALTAKLYANSLEKLDKLSGRRKNLPTGSSRAAVTTANAKWSISAEDANRRRDAFLRAVKSLGNQV